MKYLVTYDLNKTGQDYDGLYKAIKSYPYVHPMQSVWFIKTAQSASQISKNLMRHIDNNDSLFICEVTQNRDGWMDKGAWTFLGS